MRKKNAQITESIQSNLSTLTGINDASILALATDVGWSPGTYHVFDGTDMVRLPKMEYPVKTINSDTYQVTINDNGFILRSEAEVGDTTLICDTDITVPGFNFIAVADYGSLTITGTAGSNASGNGTNVIPSGSVATVICQHTGRLNIYGDTVQQNGSTSTHASLPTPVANYTGQQRIVSDCNKSLWMSNGVTWQPVGVATLLASDDAYARAPSGTINTGSSGNITFGTLSERSFTEGIYVYLPTIATTPAITEGWYWCVMSSTSVGTLYDSKGGTAIDFTVGSAYVGVTTAVQGKDICTVKGNVFSQNRKVTLSVATMLTNNANVKGNTIFINGNQPIVYDAISITGYNNNDYTIVSAGSSLIIMDSSLDRATNESPVYYAVDTTTDVTISVGWTTGTTATDWITFCRFCVSLQGV